MDRLKPPKPLNLKGNLLQIVETILFMTATEYYKKPENVKSSLLYTVWANEQGNCTLHLTFLP